jgi:hypothetical protein
LGDWHANITTIQRRQCLVFTHDQTRFSLTLIGVTQEELKALTFWFSDMLGNTMLKLGYPADLMERAVYRVLIGHMGVDADRFLIVTVVARIIRRQQAVGPDPEALRIR